MGVRDMAQAVRSVRSPALAAALDYAAGGWSVIPVLGGEKRPLLRWMPYQRAAAGADEIRAWFRRWPDANLGIVTGAVSGLVVLDIDPRHGGAGALAQRIEKFGPLPATLEAETGGGGRHLYFRHPGEVLHNRVGLLAGVDLRGDGGFVVAPPSRHPSGRAYAWAPGRGPDQAAALPLPAWLLALAEGSAGQAGHPLDYWQALTREGVRQGERNNTIASLTGHLLWHGVDPAVATELLLCWNRVRCRPPLDDGEVVRTVASITRTHRRHEAGEA